MRARMRACDQRSVPPGQRDAAQPQAAAKPRASKGQNCAQLFGNSGRPPQRHKWQRHGAEWAEWAKWAARGRQCGTDRGFGSSCAVGSEEQHSGVRAAPVLVVHRAVVPACELRGPRLQCAHHRRTRLPRTPPQSAREMRRAHGKAPRRTVRSRMRNAAQRTTAGGMPQRAGCGRQQGDRRQQAQGACTRYAISSRVSREV